MSALNMRETADLKEVMDTIQNISVRLGNLADQRIGVQKRDDVPVDVRNLNLMSAELRKARAKLFKIWEKKGHFSG